jgi:isochorismate synthase
MTCELAHEIDIFIKTRQPFAVYRMPYEQEVHVVRGGGYREIEELGMLDGDGMEGFVIAPFDMRGELPIIYLPKGEETSKASEMKRADVPTYDMTREEYGDVLEVFKEHLVEGRVEKMVLARSTTIERGEGVSLGKVFEEAIERYPRMMIYICYTPVSGVWMGCSPEILVEGGQCSWRTVALAGTQMYADDIEWDAKNRSEQHYVEQYIEASVSEIGTIIDKHGPYTSRAGHLAHLRTDYFFTAPENVGIGSIAKLLHPTPAVCGLPQKESFAIIEEHESTSRQYYSGFVGVVGKESRLFVNLRCMKVMEDRCTFFAGGGILPSSRAESEWWETEAKMSTLRDIFDGQ